MLVNAYHWHKKPARGGVRWWGGEGCTGLPGQAATAVPQVRSVQRARTRGSAEKTPLTRCQAIEPISGHLKSENRLWRCYLKVAVGDRLHALLCTTGYNIVWLGHMIAKKEAYSNEEWACTGGWKGGHAGLNAIAALQPSSTSSTPVT
jgi:hypothetical protein